jgi:thioredoxin-like negative regulator of GroEL
MGTVLKDKRSVEKLFKDMGATADKPVLIIIWATWCGYCHQFMPIWRRIAREYRGKVALYKLESEMVDKVRELGGDKIARILRLHDGYPTIIKVAKGSGRLSAISGIYEYDKFVKTAGLL